MKVAVARCNLLQVGAVSTDLCPEYACVYVRACGCVCVCVHACAQSDAMSNQDTVVYYSEFPI